MTPSSSARPSACVPAATWTQEDSNPVRWLTPHSRFSQETESLEAEALPVTISCPWDRVGRHEADGSAIDYGRELAFCSRKGVRTMTPQDRLVTAPRRVVMRCPVMIKRRDAVRTICAEVPYGP